MREKVSDTQNDQRDSNIKTGMRPKYICNIKTKLEVRREQL